jgi:hypothetical protein
MQLRQGMWDVERGKGGADGGDGTGYRVDRGGDIKDIGGRRLGGGGEAD